MAEQGIEVSQTVEQEHRKKMEWTPEQRARLSAAMKVSHAARGHKGKNRPGFRTINGKQLHWTQTPSGRARCIEIKKHPTPPNIKLKAVKEILAGKPARLMAQKYGVPIKMLYSWKYQLIEKGLIERENGNSSGNISLVHVASTPPSGGEIDIQHQNQITFAVGYVKSWLTVYADSIDVPARQFTRRVGELLLRSSHG